MSVQYERHLRPRPYLKGPKPFALILLTFKDIPISYLPGPSRYFNFLTGSSRNALFDYWRDVSYQNITLEGSEVFGWYQMQFSFAKDSRNTWTSWRNEANRLCTENSIDLSQFRGGVIVIVAASVDVNYWLDSGANSMGGFIMTTGGYWGDHSFRWCKKCGCLVRPYVAANPAINGACLAGGTHDLSDSAHYAITTATNTDVTGDSGWECCSLCSVLFQTTGGLNESTQYICPGLAPNSGPHTPSRPEYKVPTATLGSSSTYQDQWKQCSACAQLTLTTSPGFCLYNNGKHETSTSTNYGLVVSATSMSLSLQACNIGRAFGLPTSWSANPDAASGDPYDVMSATATSKVMSFNFMDPKLISWTTYCGDGFDPTYSPAGPSINAPTIFKLGWFGRSYLVTEIKASDLTARKIFPVQALNDPRPEISIAPLLFYTTKDRIYTVELRQSGRWDRGIAKDCVLIHELRSKYAIGQQSFRYCRKCHGMFLASTALCGAGGLHDAKVDSVTYSLETKAGFDAPTGSHPRSHFTCNQCRAMYCPDYPLTFDGSYGCPGTYSFGIGGHVHDSNATEYIVPTDGPFVGTEKGWKRCRKCVSLVNTLNPRVVGACAAGGLHDHTGSGEGSIFIGPPTTANTKSESGFRQCLKCEVLWDARIGHCGAGGSHDYVGSEDYGIALDDGGLATGSPFQVCSKCLGFYLGGTAGTCPASGQHVFTAQKYIVHNSSDGTDCTGEPWTHCTKCCLLLNNPGSLSCAAGGTHTCTAPVSWYLPTFKNDLTYLVGKPLYTGDSWQDAKRNFRIEVGKINDDHTVSITAAQATTTTPK
jgi:hypothetical protein